MEKIKLNKNQRVYYVNLNIICGCPTHAELTFDPNELIIIDDLYDGFKILNDNNDIVQCDYSNLKYVYKIDKSSVILTDVENDVYIESPTIVVEEDNITQTLNFSVIKAKKIEELSNVCKNKIETGVTIQNKHYSFTLQDQHNLNNALALAKDTGLNVPYHADKESYSLFSYNELYIIYVSQELNLITNQTYFNQLKLYIESLTEDDIDLLNSIEYGYELQGEYFKTFDMIISQANKIIGTIINN